MSRWWLVIDYCNVAPTFICLIVYQHWLDKSLVTRPPYANMFFFFSNRVRFQRENFQVSKSLWRSPLMTHIYASICHVYHIGVCHIHCQTITIYWWPSVSPNYIIFVLLCFKDDLSLVFTCQTVISHDTDILLLVIKRGNYISQNNFRSRSIDIQFISWIKQSVPRYIFYVPRTGSGDYTNLL